MRRLFAAAYVSALIASYIVWHFRSPLPLREGLSAAYVQEIHGESPEARTIRLAYLDTASGGRDSLPVVFVHGSPGSSEAFHALLERLPKTRRYIVPDLPGFGGSTRDLPDYSFRAHARYLIELLDALRIPKAHLVGFSMGGGVVLSMSDIAPERVASIVMLSAIGVQEDELLGWYDANHALHGLQLGALQFLRIAAPHFGMLDRIPFDVEYARNFYDSDQRPLRRELEGYRGPMLILHGRNDRNVPVKAAIKHHQIVPQSRMMLFVGNHFLLFDHAEWLAPPLEEFWGIRPRM